MFFCHMRAVAKINQNAASVLVEWQGWQSGFHSVVQRVRALMPPQRYSRVYATARSGNMHRPEAGWCHRTILVPAITALGTMSERQQPQLKHARRA